MRARLRYALAALSSGQLVSGPRGGILGGSYCLILPCEPIK